MNFGPEQFLTYCINFGYMALVFSFFLGLLRLIKGPTIQDRVVAIDLISMVLMGITTLFLISSGTFVFIDVVGVVVLISFLGTVAYAMHLEREASS